MDEKALQGKRIIVGVTGSIAAVKAHVIIRELTRHGAEVIPVLTESAQQFTTPTALSALSRSASITEIFPVAQEAEGNSGTWHVQLARSASAMLIAPCSATTIGKLRAGIYDNPVLLLASSLPASTPLFLAPAMDEEMWLQPAVQENLEVLLLRHALTFGPVSGPLASGLTGMGRMLEPVEIVSRLIQALSTSKPLLGKRVLITGGPTYEPIDPVRFIGNRSSGKMAAALANVANEMGANVTLVMGPSNSVTNEGIQRINIETANEMAVAVRKYSDDSSVIIMSAAVSDFTPRSVSATKIKKRDKANSEHSISLELEATTDILRELGKGKRTDQVLVGFALEKGGNAEQYARNKVAEKHLDMIVLNNIDDPGAGFGYDTNKISLFFRDGYVRSLPLLSKEECARHILAEATTLLSQKND